MLNPIDDCLPCYTSISMINVHPYSESQSFHRSLVPPSIHRVDSSFQFFNPFSRNGANFSTYSHVSSKPLTDFRVESILKESESESFEKVIEKPKKQTKSRRNAKQDDTEKVEKKKKTGKIQTREKFSSPPPPSPLAAPKTRSKRSKAVPLTSTPTSHECEDKSRAFNRGPRIPFTTQQIHALEEKFKETSYLSSQEVWKLSKQLSIPENRVKIWFQNRRARRKRETSNSIDPSETKEPSSIKPVLETSDDELSQ